LSTILSESTVLLSGLRPREVVRCRQCLLVQFRTLSDLCRRCEHPLAPPPRPDLGVSGALSDVRGRASDHLRFSAEHQSLHEKLHSRTRTARELTIGRKLRELRDQRCLTQQQMAVKAGVPRTYISRIENARLLPGPVMLRRISEALEVGILDLLPSNRNGNGQSFGEEDPYWTSLTGYFTQLRPLEMSMVLDHVRTMIGENSSHSFVPAMMAK
jgi:transcriptional regulator with XRE-family HTH domain